MLLTGMKLGHFRLKDLIGRSANDVYLADDLHLPGREVAIKIMQTDITSFLTSDKLNEAVAQFEHEALIVSKLYHPHILQLFEYGQETQDATIFAYLVMPYKKDGTLERWVKHRTASFRNLLPLQDIASIISTAADALQYAHDAGIIHRDVKFSNFLIDDKTSHLDYPRILLADFGIAKFGEVNQTTRAIGTFDYMAPEQWDGHPTKACDQYSLAVIAYKLLTGHMPFKGNPLELYRQHHDVTPLAPSQLNLALPPTIDAIILKALAKKPQDRFRTVQAFAFAFREAIPSPTNASTLGQALRVAVLENESLHPNIIERRRTLLQLLQGTVSLAKRFFSLRYISKKTPDFLGQETFKNQVGDNVSVSSSALPPPGASTVLFSAEALPSHELKDFFISYHKNDYFWAKWIAQKLKDAGYDVLLPPWGVRPSSIIDLEMRKAKAKAKRIIAVLSPSYCSILIAQPLSIDTFKKYAVGEYEILISVCVQDCGRKFRKLLESLHYIDLVGEIGEDEVTAQEMLLAGVQNEGIQLTTRAAFPGTKSRHSTGNPSKYSYIITSMLGRTTKQSHDKRESSTSIQQQKLQETQLPYAGGIEVFFSYSHKDEKMRDQLDKHLSALKRQELVTTWHDRKIRPGDVWNQEIDTHLSTASVILLLISPDFVHSEYCYSKEMTYALERHTKREARVIPIILRPTDLEGTPLETLQALPKGAKAVTNWSNPDDAFHNIVKGIRRELNNLMLQA